MKAREKLSPVAVAADEITVVKCNICLSIVQFLGACTLPEKGSIAKNTWIQSHHLQTTDIFIFIWYVWTLRFFMFSLTVYVVTVLC